ncbi:M15 family metallopeptidase [Hymenobacter busanensis]|uniref:M15 family metallopeptidase n=1 Tax=Hymenobacter busanensis TaxID=2607656 RepID=A0A7L4ZU84_9BACT|nr:M15 family metallopeptidase [Hymenobacter busanensis]KAA9339869.1 M15 family metallopeptidase [Hymenobacter busanensis]QHJ06376.1 hypothetical protein GUY19_03305 [Hymenobacter busanensis]
MVKWLFVGFTALFGFMLNFGFTPDVETKLKALERVTALRLRVFFLLCRVCLGLRAIITSGLRSTAQQAALHAADPRNAAAGSSSHERGLSADVNFLDAAGNNVLRKATPKSVWEKSGVVALAALCGLRWGGTAFPGYYDPVHFDSL